MKDSLFDILFKKSFIYREDPPFTLVSGRESFHYFDCKATILTQEGLFLIGEVMFDLLKDYIRERNITGIGGLTLGADPIALSISIAAYNRKVLISPLIVRKEAKKHGTQKWIEGDIERMERVIVIDDVITTGGSTITAIERIKEAGLSVDLAAVVIDREEGGRENIENAGVGVMSLFTKSDFDARRLNSVNS